MTPRTASQACAHAEQAIVDEHYDQALALYGLALSAQPDDLDARLRVADCLLALGDIQRASVVYTTLARHAAHAGHPLLAIVAVKVLTALDAALQPLGRALADLYAADAGRLGPSVRRAPPADVALVAEETARWLALSGAALCAEAERVGRDVSHVTRAYPPCLPPIPLLSGLGKDDFVAVLATMQLRRQRPRQAVVTEGELGSSFFVVARGDLRVSRRDGDGFVELATLHEGAVFGEVALVSRSPRTASVETTQSTDLFEVPVEALAQLSQGAGTIARALAKFTRERLLLNLINTAPLFRPLDRDQRIDLVRHFRAHEVAVDTDLIREGEQVPGLYLVLDGAVDVWKRDENEKVLLATLRGGDVFGEMSLVSRAPAVATVTAAAHSTVLVLERNSLERVMERVPELRTYLERLGEERAMDTRMWLDDAMSAEDGERILDDSVFH